MTITVRLFALARDLADAETLTIELPTGSTVADLRSKLAREYPQLAAILPTCMIAVDSNYATDDLVITSNGEVACLPPVSGG